MADAAPRQQPVLLLLKGQPGSGKSTLAALLASTLSWPLVDKDDARSSMQVLAVAHPGIDWWVVGCGLGSCSRHSAGLPRKLTCHCCDTGSCKQSPHPPPSRNTLAYDVMWRVAGTQLRCGLSVLVDCPLARRALFNQAAALAQQVGGCCWGCGAAPGCRAGSRQWFRMRQACLC